MSVLYAASDEETPDCPLCMEMFELDDLNFYPCACGYQICRFCWNKILTEAEGGQGRCPACRSPYSENPVDFKPLSTEEVAKIKAEKRQKDQARKQRVSENRKHLANVRVVQKNLVFVVGLAPRLADPEVLKKPEYFGKFGKIHKVVINHSTSYAGNQNQGPSASAYVTYYKSEDALRAIQAVNNIFIEGRTLKASLGTTKYCSHFMKNQACPKHDCMYLHELGDDAASFTKEQMQQGKHTEYERSLHDEMGHQHSDYSNQRDGDSHEAEESPPSPSDLDRTSAGSAAHANNNNNNNEHRFEDQNEDDNDENHDQEDDEDDDNDAIDRHHLNHHHHLHRQHQAHNVNHSTKSDSRSVSPKDGWPDLGRDSTRIPPHSPIPSENRSKAMSPRNEESNGKEEPVSTSESLPNDEVRTDPQGSASNHRSTDEIMRQMRKGGEPSAQSGTSNRSDMNNWGVISSGSPVPFDEEDLGFDPFELSQQALADEMMQESQNKSQQQQHQQQQQHHHHHHHHHHNHHQQQQPQHHHQHHLNASSVDNGLHFLSRGSSGNHPSDPSSSLFLSGGGGNGGQHPPLHTPFIGGGGGASNLATRTKAPPPGFSLNNLSSNSSVPGLNRFNGRGNFDPFGGGGGLGNLGSQSFPNMHPDLDVGNSMDGVPMGLSSRLHPAMSNLHLGSGGGGGGGVSSSSNSSRGGQNSSSWQNKDWQDGFRALLPNVNVSFGPSNSFMDGGPPHPRAPPLPGFPQRNNSNSSSSLGNAVAAAAAAGMSMPNREDNHMGMVRQRSVGAPHHPSMAARQQSWHPHPPSSADWTALDPAIVTGQLAQKGMPNIRPESPHNWIKANLEQLTSEPNFSSLFGGRDTFESNGMPLVSGYSGLSLSGGSGNGLGSSDNRISPSMMRHPSHPASLAQWGNNGSSVTPTPAPPGFSNTLTSKHNFRGASRHDNISNMDSKKS